MQRLKQYLLKNKYILSFFKSLKKKLDARRKDKENYFTISRITYKKIRDIKNDFRKKINQICVVINKNAQEIYQYGLNNSTKQKISQSELEMISNMGDQMGKVFRYNGEIYRGIYQKSEESFYSIYKSGVLQGLSDLHLIPKVKITNFVTEQFSVILHVEEVYIQKNDLWSYSMVLDACYLISILYFVLQKYNLTLCDGHLNNISFEKGRPIFIDIGSIIPESSTGAMEELVFGGLYRLLFGYLGNCMLYRLPSHNGNNNNIFIKPRCYNQFTRDYRFCLRELKKAMLIHGGMKKYKIAHKVFDLNDVRPEFINILFDEKTVKGNESNGNFECLFNLLDWNEFVDMSIIDTGGVFPVIKIAIQNGIHFKFVNVIDFLEPRLDINYYHCNLDVDIAFSLINYMYIHDEKLVDIIESDVALCINPISNSGSFQGINMSSIAYSLNKIGKRYVVVFIDYKSENNLESYDELKQELGIYYKIEDICNSEMRCFIGRRD